MSNQNSSEIAKDIVIAAIQSDYILKPRRGQYKDIDEMLEYNEKRAKEIGKLYKSVAKAVNEAMQGNFDTTE